MSDGRLNFKITVDDKDAIDGINRMQKGVNGLTFTKPTESINRLKKEIEEVNEVLNKNRKSLTDLNFKISNTAPGQLKKDLQLERNSLKKSIQEDELALKNLNYELKRTKASHTTVNAELLKTRQQMSALAVLGKQNTAEYQQLSAKAKEYSGVLKQVNTDSNTAKSTFGGLFKTIASSFGIMTAFYAVIGAISGAFRQIVEFDKAMVNMSAIAGQSRKELKDLEVEIRNVAKGSLNTATQVAEMATELIRLGTTPEGVKALLKPVNDLSIATGLAADKTAILVKGTLNAFQEGEGAATRYADVIAASLNLTALDAQKFGDAFKYIGATASVAGYSIEETAAMVGVLVDNNVQASSAGRILSSVLGRLAKDGKDLETELNKVRTSQDQMAQASKTFGAEGARLAVILANNKDRLAELTSALQSSGGSLEKLTNSQLKSLSAQFQIMSSAWTEFILSVDSGNGIISKIASAFINLGTGIAMALSPSEQLSESLRNEQIELNILVGQITDVNIKNLERATLINELKEKYPEYVRLIGEENLSNENLRKSLSDVNEEYIKRIALQEESEKLEAAIATRDAWAVGVLENQKDLYKELISINTEYNLGLEITPTNAYEMADKVQLAARKNISAYQQLKINALQKDYETFSRNADEATKNVRKVEQAYKDLLKALGVKTPTQIAQENSIYEYNKKLTEAISKAKSLGGKVGKDFSEFDLTGINNYIKKAEQVNEVVSKDAEKAAKKAENLAKKRIDFLDQISKAERELNNSVLGEREQVLAKINDKYDDMLKKAKELKANEEAINRINALREKETAIATYRLDTTALTTSLEQQKKDYEDFENFKKKVGIEKSKEMYAGIIDVSKNYQQVLQDELAGFEGRNLTDIEKERVNELFNLLQDYNIAKVDADRKSLEELVASTQTAQERILVIQQEYAKKREQAEGIANENIRNERLRVLEEQEKQATSVIENEIYERNKTERDLIRQLTSYTKKELKNRIKSTEEFLTIAGENLSESQRKTLEGELSLLNALNGSTDLIIRQNALLKEKERITNDIKNNTSKDPEIARKLNRELEDVNLLLDDNNKEMRSTADYVNLAVYAVNELASAFGDVNNESNEALSNFTSIVSQMASGNIAGTIMSMVGVLIKGLGEMFGGTTDEDRNREAERLRNEEEYNKMLRDRLLLEIKLNDAYQSRISAINEEKEALLQNQKTAVDRIKQIVTELRRLYVDVAGGGSKKIWDKYGLDKYFEGGLKISQELIDKLRQLKNELQFGKTTSPLYDELFRLSEELGGIDEAIRQLEKELKDRLTGTTAQSLGDSIREGIASGKRSFEDFADDIEGFLRNAILAGMSAEIIEPQIQQLQDMLYEMMKDGVLTEEERRKFEEEYARIAEEAGKYLDLINQAGVNIGGLDDFGAGTADGIKRITETQADRLTGILSGMQVDVIASRQILSDSRNLLSSSLDNLIAIEFNTRATADNTYQMVQILQNNQAKALGMI